MLVGIRRRLCERKNFTNGDREQISLTKMIANYVHPTGASALFCLKTASDLACSSLRTDFGHGAMRAIGGDTVFAPCSG